jgi:hypothetical protein
MHACILFVFCFPSFIVAVSSSRSAKAIILEMILGF